MLIDNFLKASDENQIRVTVTGKRKREVGLVVRGKYVALAKDIRMAKLLNEKLHKKKLKYSHFDFVKTEDVVKFPFFTLD